jgi:catalase
MSEKKVLTTESGAPVADNQNSQTAGQAGPVLLQDAHLIEKLARFDRERIPERVVHAKGSGAYGHFEVTKDVTKWTRAKFLAKVGKKTEVFARFSTVAGERGSADTVRDPRGFALKFYTEDGNYDLVGNDTPIFFIRDPLKFPDFIHSQKRDPHTNMQDPNNAWDFFSHSPEATHQFTWLFGDRGIPASYRHMDGFGSHTYQWVNAKGEAFWVKYHFKTDQGIRCLTAQEAARIAGSDPDYCQRDLMGAIDRGEFPSWRSAGWCSTATQKTISPTSSSRRSARRTTYPASAPRPTRCCRDASSRTPTRSAIGSASTTPSFRSTVHMPPRPRTTAGMA